jgi:small-conductance mechanosensitive channel
MILGEFGFNLGPVIASAGIVGVAVGLGAQTLVRDVISGIFMLVEDQYGVGDRVDVLTIKGVVERVGLRITTVRSDDGMLWYIRNGEILTLGNGSKK